MKGRVLLGHLWRRHRLALLFLAIGMFLFEWIFTRIAPEPAQAERIRGLLFGFVPPAVMEVFGQEMLANLTARGFLGFGWVHPFPVLMLAIWTVRVSAGSLAGEIARGTMDLVAARPVSRASLVTTTALTLGLGLAVIVAAGWAATAVGLAIRPLDGVRGADFLRVAGAAWLLFLAFGAVGLVVSATHRSGGGAIALTSALLAVSFAVDFLARVWRPIAWSRPWSLFGYYQPQQILTRGLAREDAMLLGLVALVALALAFAVFQRRDL